MVEGNRKMMEAIGGYFELANRENGVFPHGNGILLNTGRNALEYILRTLGVVNNIYLPFYTCEVVLEPITKLGIPYQFYHINEQLEIAQPICLKEGEYLVANNYFGLKDTYINALAEQFKDRLIVDCAQAFFANPIPSIMMFYSCRKFVGVADGGVAYTQNDDILQMMLLDEDDTSDHNGHLFTRKRYGAEAGFKEFLENECKLDNQPIKIMSHQTRDVLEHIDFDNIRIKRQNNFNYLHEALGWTNKLQLKIKDLQDAAPMIYPYWVSGGQNLRNKLITNKVFCARYWPNVTEWCGANELEYDFAQNLIAIPCDQRYGTSEMQRIISIINE